MSLPSLAEWLIVLLFVGVPWLVLRMYGRPELVHVQGAGHLEESCRHACSVWAHRAHDQRGQAQTGSSFFNELRIV